MVSHIGSLTKNQDSLFWRNNAFISRCLYFIGSFRGGVYLRKLDFKKDKSMKDPNGCLYDEDGYHFQNGEGEDYPVNPFGDNDCSGDDEE